MMSTRPGRVRLARLTDLAALGELSRWSHARGDEAARRALAGAAGEASHVSVFSLFRMPLGAFQPHDPLYVYEEEGRLAGLARVDRDTQRDEWTIVELDAVDQGDRAPRRATSASGWSTTCCATAASGARARFHVACADEDDNVELFMQAGFARYGEEMILHRPGGQPWPTCPRAAAARLRHPPSGPLDALPLNRLYAAVDAAALWRASKATACRTGSGGSHGAHPALLADPHPSLRRRRDVWSRMREPAAAQELAAFLQVGVAKEDQPHYLRVLCRPDHDPTDLIAYGLARHRRPERGSGSQGAGDHDLGTRGS